MPIEIKELHIRVEVNEPKAEDAAGTTGSPQHIFVDASDNLWIGRDGTPTNLSWKWTRAKGSQELGQRHLHEHRRPQAGRRRGRRRRAHGRGFVQLRAGRGPIHRERRRLPLPGGPNHVADGGRDILIGGVGADHLDATNNRSHLLSFTKVMLRTDQDPGSDIGESLVVGDSPSGELDPQGRLLLGSEQDIWRDGDFDGDGKDDLELTSPTPLIPICRSRLQIREASPSSWQSMHCCSSGKGGALNAQAGGAARTLAR